MLCKVKDWEEHQHYKNRTPPWIKLHRAILDDFKFHSLPVASRALAPMLWLLSSESEGVVDCSEGFLSFRLRMTPKEARDAVKPLIDNGWLTPVQDASESLAKRKQNACLEGETEKEGEKEGDGAQPAPPKKACRLPDDFPCETDLQWAKANEPGVDAKREAAKFRDYWKGKSGKDAAKLDWPATWRNWIRKAAEWSKKPSGDDARNDAVAAAKELRRQRNG